MQGKSVSPLTFSGKPQLRMWYQVFHSWMRAVSMAEMKSQTPSAVLTQISIAPTPFISGMARLGSRSAARSCDCVSSSAVRNPSLSRSAFAKGSGNRPWVASWGESTPSPEVSSRFSQRCAWAWGLICSPLAEWA